MHALARKPPQVCDHFESYITPGEYKALTSESFVENQKIVLLAQRALAIGLTHPSEQTAAKIIGVMNMCEGAETVAEKSLERVRKLKASLKRHGRCTAVRGPQEYPAQSSQLQRDYKAIYEEAYKHEAPVHPDQLQLAGLRRAQSCVPHRATNSLVTEGRAVGNTETTLDLVRREIRAFVRGPGLHLAKERS